MRRLNACLLAIALPSALAMTTLPAPILAAPAVELAPSTPWDMHYADDSCLLGRVFGKDEESVTLLLERFRPGGFFELKVVGKRFRKHTPGMPVRSGFGPRVGLSNSAAITAKTDDTFGSMLFLGGWDLLGPVASSDQKPRPISVAMAAKIIEFTIERGGGPPFTLKLGRMDRPLLAMDTCMTALVKSWGFDAARLARYRSGPAIKGRPGNWVTDQDYPKDMQRGGFSGLVQFRLTVDASGKPSACVIQRQTKPEGFAALTCKLLMERARFEPALDEDGKPAPGYFISSVRFNNPY